MNLRPALVFASPRGPYRSDAVVLACFDARFDLALRKLLRRLAFQNPDVIRVAGGLVAGSDFSCLADDCLLYGTSLMAIESCR
jgi:hypothetical protein